MPGGAGRRHARVPQNAKRHKRRAARHEDARPNAAGEAPEAGREKDQKERARDAGQPGRSRGIADRSLHEERQVIEGDVKRAVDDERREVGHCEVARAKEREGNQWMRRPRHVEGESDRTEHADGKRDVAQWILPIALLAVDRSEGEPANRQGDDRGPEPVEMRRGGLITAFWHVDVGRPERNQDQRHVDKEGGAPRDRVHQQAADERTENSGCAGGTGPQTEGPALRLPLEVGREERERPGDQDGPGDPLENPKEHEELGVGGETAEYRRDAEADQAVEEHALAAVVVGERAGQDEQRAERQQVGVVDVGLAFQDAEPESRQVPADPGEGDVDHGGVEEHDAGPEHGGNQDPSAPVGHVLPPSVLADSKTRLKSLLIPDQLSRVAAALAPTAMLSSRTRPQPWLRCGSMRNVPSTTSRPRAVRSASNGAPAAQACGREAVGYSTGAPVSLRGKPAKTSGSRYPNASAAWIASGRGGTPPRDDHSGACPRPRSPCRAARSSR